MSQLIFPIVETTKNQLVALDGNVASFFEMLAPDQEQMTPSELERFYHGVGSSLDQLNEDHYFKFYAWNGKNYLETNAAEVPRISGIELVPCENGLEVFFQNSELISDLGFYDDSLSFNGEYWRVLSVSDFDENPLYSSPLPVDCEYVLTLKRQSTLKGISKLERIRSGHLNALFKSKRDPRSEGAYNQAEELLEDLTHGRESLFSLEMFIVVKALDLALLNHKTKKLYERLSTRGIKTLCEGHSLRHLKSGLGDLFNELIPGVKPKLGLRTLSDKTSHLRYLLPLHNSYLMESGQVFHDIHGKAIFLNAFNKKLPNRNILISGATGAGKSVLVNKIIHPLVPQHPTVILDMGGSFKRLTLYHEGSYLKQGINPMQFRDAEFLCEIILTQVDQARFDKLERGRMLKALREILEDQSVVTFRAVLARLESDFKDITLYFEECLSVFSDDNANDVNLLYVDIQDYPPSMVAPVILFVLEYYKRIKVSEKILVFDECWEFLTGHAKYIAKSFRTIRKTGGLAIALSQGLEDFMKLDSELCRAITNNAFIKIFFSQDLSPNEIVSDFDIERISSLQYEKGVYSQFYVLAKNRSLCKIVACYLDALELELFHTEDGEDQPLMNYLNDHRRYFSSNRETIDNFVRIRYGEANLFYSA